MSYGRKKLPSYHKQNTSTGRAKKRRKVTKDPVSDSETFSPLDVHEIEFDEDKTREEMRILIRVSPVLYP